MIITSVELYLTVYSIPYKLYYVFFSSEKGDSTRYGGVKVEVCMVFIITVN